MRDAILEMVIFVQNSILYKGNVHFSPLRDFKTSRVAFLTYDKIFIMGV